MRPARQQKKPDEPRSNVPRERVLSLWQVGLVQPADGPRPNAPGAGTGQQAGRWAHGAGSSRTQACLHCAVRSRARSMPDPRNGSASLNAMP